MLYDSNFCTDTDAKNNHSYVDETPGVTYKENIRLFILKNKNTADTLKWHDKKK